MASRCFFPREAEAGSRHQHHSQSKAAAEALEQLHNGGRVLSREDVGGAVRVKIVVSKRELKHMVAALGGGGEAAAAAAAVAAGERHRQRAAGGGGGGAGGPGAEQRLQLLRRRSMRRAAEAARRMQANGEWEPGLQSIPEEMYVYSAVDLFRCGGDSAARRGLRSSSHRRPPDLLPSFARLSPAGIWIFFSASPSHPE
ncbi:hypothetical protein GUJ93_ZPchr0002g23910 [Zizania palustris]|uniref:Uncharacterized protein n=1 Tax=Zizania palustris TaxID=103762 RepID=A0A8J5VBY2_ZIZPA|nr:hypothetical protein GUJ93_ZPchr0002g23910 [Zizania palustris]